MATVDITNGTQYGTHPSAHAHVYQAGYVPIPVNFAEAAAKKGSALAAGDIIRVMELPAKTSVHLGTLSVKVASGADLTTCTLNVGPEGDGARFVSGFNYKTAAVDDFAADTGGTRTIVGKVPSYLVLTIATLTGALTTGTVVVGASLLDISARQVNAGLATRT